MATEASQSAKDIFRGYRSEDGQWPQPFVPTGRQRWRWQAVGRRTAFIRRTALPICDVCALLLAGLLAGSGWLAIGYGAAVLIFLRLNGRQRLRICLRLSDEIPGLAAAAILPIPLFLFSVNPRALVRLAVVSGVLLMTIRLALYATLRVANRRRWLVERALIVGSGQPGVEIGEAIRENPEIGLEHVGFIDSEPHGRTHSLP